MKEFDLTMPVREARGKMEGQVYTCAQYGDRVRELEFTAENGELTLWGVYNEILLEMQNHFGWVPDTCRRYDNSVNSVIAPVFAGIAFKDISEVDLYSGWEEIEKIPLSNDERRKAFRNFRIIFEWGYQKGYTETTLWGCPTENDVSVGTDIQRTEEEWEKEEGRRLANIKLHNQATFTLENEIRIAKRMLSHCREDGRNFGGLITLFGDPRPSETVQFTFDELQRSTNGEWRLVLDSTQDPVTLKKQKRGKSKNFARGIYVPNFLAKEIRKRRAELEMIYGDVGSFPIACYGEDHRRFSTRKELNDTVKIAYQECGGEEALYAQVCGEIAADPKLKSIYGKSPSTYLLRHQAITAMVSADCLQGEIYVSAGHSSEDPRVKREDFTNPDKYGEMTRKLRRRPLVQYFEEREEYELVTVQGLEKGTILTEIDGNCVLKFTEKREFLLEAHALQRNVPLNIRASGADILDCYYLPMLERQAPETICMRTPFFYYAKTIKELEGNHEMTNLYPVPIMRNQELLEKLANGEFLQQKSSVNGIPAIQSEAIALAKKTEMESCQKNLKSEKSARRQKGRSEARLYLVDEERGLFPVKSVFETRNKNTRGERLVDKTVKVGSVIEHREENDAFVIDRNGVLFFLSRGTQLDSLAVRDLPVVALRKGGFLVQCPSNLQHTKASFVCVTDQGGICRVGMEAIGNKSLEGKQLFTLREKETMVAAACICSVDDDVLVVTARGMALRLHAKSVVSKKTCGVQFVDGISLEKDDIPVACIPYHRDTELFAMKEHGMILRIKCSEKELRAKARGAKGVEFVSVPKTDRVVSLVEAYDFVLLVSSDGRGLCVDKGQIPCTHRKTKGVQGIKNKEGSVVVGALGLVKQCDADLLLDESYARA